jgi:hypothetical protein
VITLAYTAIVVSVVFYVRGNCFYYSHISNQPIRVCVIVACEDPSYAVTLQLTLIVYYV